MGRHLGRRLGAPVPSGVLAGSEGVADLDCGRSAATCRLVRLFTERQRFRRRVAHGEPPEACKPVEGEIVRVVLIMSAAKSSSNAVLTTATMSSPSNSQSGY